MNRLATLLVGLRTLLLATLAGAPAVHAQGLPSSDDAAWAAAVAADTPEAYQQYLEEFPAGGHVEEAFRLLIESQLEDAPDSARGFDLY
jgi:hypothetical protein